MPQITPNRASAAETLVEFLQEAAREFGPRDALLFKPGFRYQRWTYDDVWDGAGRVAALLQQRGLGKGDRAVLWAPNMPQWVLAFFGCLRAGVVVVPLDLTSAPDFARNVAGKTSPKLAFVSRFTPDVHEELGLPEVFLEELDGLIDGMPQPEDVDIGGDDLVEVMFTSGTTGDPKGVMLSHENLMSNVRSIIQYVPGQPSDRLVSILPLSHMLEQMGGLLLTLRSGANVTYPTSRQPTVLFRTMSERKVTLLVLVPLVLDLFMNGIEREVRRQGKESSWRLLMKIAHHAPSGLRRTLFRRVHKRLGGSLGVVFSGGAALDSELGNKWEMLGVDVIQGYGATEASPVISIHEIDSPRFDSVGRPLPGVDVQIADDGEVLVRGPNVTSGYWEAPEQTESSFADGWYKTGDQGFFDDEGFLHLQGRKKDMIALASGQNVYPEDVEAVLHKHDDVTDAVVVGLPKGALVEVHAALIMDDSAKSAAVVSWANERLAEHQRIRGSTVWPDEDFPRTHTLKVKKGVVVDILSGSEPTSPAAIGSSPSTNGAGPPPLHRLIVEVGGVSFADVAPDRALGDDLDLDSLNRVELLSAVEGELGVYLDESQVGPDTTVAQLTTMVEQGSGAPAMRFAGWGMSWWCRPLRGAIQRGFIFPVLRLPYRLKVTGREDLDGAGGPVLYVANHNLPMDNGLIIKAFPSSRRRRLAIAAAANLFDNPFWAVVNPLVGNGFPFSKEGAIRVSLENVGRILDGGWSVLIYPEGKLTTGGPIQPFLSGTGLLAVEGRVPVVPLRLHINDMGSPQGFPFWKRGDMEVRFGKPISFPPGTDYEEATGAIEEAIKAL